MMEVYNRVIECSEVEESEGTNSGLDSLLYGKVPAKDQLSISPKLTLYVQVKLELGHRANLRLKPTFEGFTHDWELFIRSPEGAANCALHLFIRRVEFHLHQSFSREKIVQKEPPFKLNESGYAGFVLPIDVYLRNPGQPKKIRFLYDLFIDPRRSTSHVRYEKVTFKNPPSAFRDLLFKGGGQLIRRKVRMSDSGFASFCRNLSSSVGYNFSQSFSSKPSITSAAGAESHQSRDFSSAANTTDSKDWFRVKQELTDRSDADQDKENFPTDDSRNQRNSQAKSSISFLQDWLRNIRQNKSKNVSTFSLSGTNIPSSSGERCHATKVGRQGVQRQLAEKDANRSEMFSAHKTKTTKSMDRGTGAGGPIRRGPGRPRKNPNPQFPSDASRKSTSINARRLSVPKKFVPSERSEFKVDSGLLQRPKTNRDILNSITRRRFLKTKGNELKPYTFSPSCNASELYRKSLPKHSPLSSDPLTSNSENSWSRGVASPVPVKRRGPGRPRKNPLVEVQRWQTAGRPDPKEGKRTRAVTTRAPYYSHPRDNFDRNIHSHQSQGIIQRNSGSDDDDDDDVIITGYSPPRKQQSHGVPPGGEWLSGGGQTKKVRRKRSTQLQLLRSATDEFSRAPKTEMKPYVYSDENVIPSSAKDVDFSLAPTARFSKFEEERSELKRGRERTHSFKYDSEEEGATQGTSASSDMSAEYHTTVHRSPVFSRTGNSGRGNTAASDRKWLTSTPVRRQKSVPRRSSVAANRKKRSQKNNEDRAWNRCTHNDRSPWKNKRKLTKKPGTKTTPLFHGSRQFPLPPSDNDGPCFYPEPAAAATVTAQSLPGISEEVTVSGEPVAVLMELQQRLASLSDPVMLRRVVEIVEDSGKYRLDDAMFDFDLCNLDRNTVNRLYDCLQISSSSVL